MSRLDLLVQETDRDRFARTSMVQIGSKKIRTPNFCSLIQYPWEFEAFMRLGLTASDTEQLGSYVMRVFDASDIIVPRIRNKGQTDLMQGNFTDELFNKFQKQNILFVDPALEYLFHEFYFQRFKKASESVPIPRQITNFLNARERRRKNSSAEDYKRWKRQNHTKFWYELDRDPRQRNDMIASFLDLELICGTDILVPPVPFVTSEGLLDIALRVNKISQAIATERAECATYFLLQKSILRHETMLDKIINFIKNDPNTLTIFKFKNLTLWESGCIVERELFRKLEDAITDIKKSNTKKLYMILESSYQSFMCGCFFDIVSSSLRGFDKDSNYGQTGFGAWFYPEKLCHIKFSDLPVIMRNNEGHLPCDCAYCRNITVPKLKNMSMEEWRDGRRTHYALSMNGLMKMIDEAIKTRKIELAREFLINSEMRNLKDLVPRF
jgi:hypothetical protein